MAVESRACVGELLVAGCAAESERRGHGELRSCEG